MNNNKFSIITNEHNSPFRTSKSFSFKSSLGLFVYKVKKDSNGVIISCEKSNIFLYYCILCLLFTVYKNLPKKIQISTSLCIILRKEASDTWQKNFIKIKKGTNQIWVPNQEYIIFLINHFFSCVRILWWYVSKQKINYLLFLIIMQLKLVWNIDRLQVAKVSLLYLFSPFTRVF